MNLCSKSHEEVCYEGKTCPVCDALDEVTYWSDMVTEREEEIETLKAQLEE